MEFHARHAVIYLKGLIVHVSLIGRSEQTSTGILLNAVASKDSLGHQVKITFDANSNFFKNVVRQHWEGKLATMDKTKSKHVAAEIESHLSKMNPHIDKLDYEIFCVPNIIAHSKHITKEELQDYLKLLESLAVGYSSTLGRELTSLVLIGLTSKARNSASAERYYKSLTGYVQGRVTRYESAIDRKRKRVHGLSMLLQREQSSLLRLFRRRRIQVLSKKIDVNIKDIEALTMKLQTYSNVSVSMRERVSAAAPAPSLPGLPPRKD